jgi:hypothetical protein
MVRLGRRWCRILGIAPDHPPQGRPGPGRRVAEAAARVAAACAAELAPPPSPFPPGALPTARPFTRIQRRRVPAPPLAVGIACDVSGSMGSYAGPVASTAWILARAVTARARTA